MPGILTILLLSLSPPYHVASAPAVSPAEFRAWYDAALRGRLSMPADVSRSARRFRYVFVAGFHNERMPGYFSQNARSFALAAYPGGQSISCIPARTKRWPETPAPFARSCWRSPEEGPEKLVVIGHSRGACDVLAFALQNPEFVAKHVEALFLVQGAFGGTGIADYLAGEGPPIDNSMPWRHRVLAHLLGRLETFLLDRGKHGGLKALTTRASTEFWERTLEEYQASIPIVSPRAFYVTTRTVPARLQPLQQAVAWYLAYLGPNDGIIALEDQCVPGVGTIVAVLDAGHTDLTNRFPSARSRPRLRKALVDAIVMAVASPASGRLSEHERQPDSHLTRR